MFNLLLTIYYHPSFNLIMKCWETLLFEIETLVSKPHLRSSHYLWLIENIRNFFLVDGGFTAWSAYTKCSSTCGGGTQERTRSCANPEPAHGGKECVGPTTDTRQCGEDPCPG